MKDVYRRPHCRRQSGKAFVRRARTWLSGRQETVSVHPLALAVSLYRGGVKRGLSLLTYQSFFEHELKKLIQEAVEARKENLALGNGTVDFAAYRNQVGVVAGLRLALELCDEANRVCEQKERTG